MVNNICVLTHQSGFQAINHGFLTKGLDQEPDCPGCQRNALAVRQLLKGQLVLLIASCAWP
jgi:hypothetical protein